MWNGNGEEQKEEEEEEGGGGGGYGAGEQGDWGMIVWHSRDHPTVTIWFGRDFLIAKAIVQWSYVLSINKCTLIPPMCNNMRRRRV